MAIRIIRDPLRCTKCGKQKSPEEFASRPDRPLGRSSRCKQCMNALQRAYRKSDKFRRYQEANAARDFAVRRNRLMVKRYGIGHAEYDALVEAQNGLCAICCQPPGKKGLCVDHCHSSGNVRALLCQYCNSGLGIFKDDPDLLRKAADYLQACGSWGDGKRVKA